MSLVRLLARLTPFVLFAATAAAQPGAPLRTADVLGTWESAACEVLPDGRGGQQYRTRVITFSAERWRFFATFFAQPGCAAPLFTARIGGPYRLGALVPSGATEADLYFERLRFTALTPRAAEVLNSLGCGDRNFQPGVEQDTSDTGCVFPPTRDYRLEHDLVQLKEGLIYFGERPEENNLNLPQNRPSAVNAFGLQRLQ